LEHENFREPISIPPGSLIQDLGCHPVKLRQIGIQHHLLPTEKINRFLDALQRHQHPPPSLDFFAFF
jgi:hypothetical protein